MHAYSIILSGAMLLLSSMPSTSAFPVPSSTGVERINDEASSTGRIVMPLVPSSSSSVKSSKATATSSSNKSKKSKKPKKREEPSIFEVDLPLGMLEDSVVDLPSASAIEAAHAAHQPIYIELDERQRSAMAGGDTLLGLPEDQEVVFVNKRDRVAQRSNMLLELDTVLASMAV